MRHPQRILAIVASLFVLAAPLAAGRRGAGNPNPTQGGGQTLTTYLATLPVEPFNEAATADARFMREEEKLARDLYLAFANRWGARNFSQIARSEQHHMDLMAWLLDRHAISDPVGSKPAGIFADDSLQDRYNRLLASGGRSLQAALAAAVLVEETDIQDLDDSLEATSAADARTVYQNLAKGSRNHLRATTQALRALGVVARPQVLDQAKFDAIVASDFERQSPLDADGNLLPVSGDCPRNGSGRGNGRW